MALLLALIALTLTGVCCSIAWRAWRRSHNLALEMIQLRDRLALAERTSREEDRRARAEARAEALAAEGRTATSDETRIRDVESSLDDLRGQLSHAVEATESLAARAEALELHEATGDTEHLDVRDLVRSGLRRQGYRRVRVIEVTAGDKVLVEAERGGITAKGIAFIDLDGKVVLRSQSTLRAFP